MAACIVTEAGHYSTILRDWDGVGHDGTRDGMDSVEIIGTTPSIHGVYMGIQLIESCERVRDKKQLSFAKAWLLRLHRFCWDCVLRTWLNVLCFIVIID